MFDWSTISVNLRCESICTLEDSDKDGHGQVNNKIRKSLILLIATSVEERVFSKNLNVKETIGQCTWTYSSLMFQILCSSSVKNINSLPNCWQTCFYNPALNEELAVKDELSSQDVLRHPLVLIISIARLVYGWKRSHRTFSPCEHLLKNSLVCTRYVWNV
jgi:hypothetical protein